MERKAAGTVLTYIAGKDQVKSYYVKPFLAGCIGGFAGALAAGLVHMMVTSYGITGIFVYLIDLLAAVCIVFIISWMLHRDSPEVRLLELADGTVVETAKEIQKPEMETGVVYSPLKGQVVPLEEVPDDTFAAKVLGDGMAVIPAEGKVYAPFDGTVEKVYDSGHAIGLCSTDGIELLIHIGINTVELEGKYYKIHVSDGDAIQKGDLLMDFDRKGIKEAGYLLVTPIILTNADDFDTIRFVGHGMVDYQDILVRIEVVTGGCM